MAKENSICWKTVVEFVMLLLILLFKREYILTFKLFIYIYLNFARSSTKSNFCDHFPCSFISLVLYPSC